MDGAELIAQAVHVGLQQMGLGIYPNGAPPVPAPPAGHIRRVTGFAASKWDPRDWPETKTKRTTTITKGRAKSFYLLTKDEDFGGLTPPTARPTHARGVRFPVYAKDYRRAEVERRAWTIYGGPTGLQAARNAAKQRKDARSVRKQQRQQQAQIGQAPPDPEPPLAPGISSPVSSVGAQNEEVEVKNRNANCGPAKRKRRHPPSDTPPATFSDDERPPQAAVGPSTPARRNTTNQLIAGPSSQTSAKQRSGVVEISCSSDSDDDAALPPSSAPVTPSSAKKTSCKGPSEVFEIEDSDDEYMRFKARRS
ncbi:hypothetical protein NLJ89_g201 [Agrocybe chaxingu]|uniref:Uncharacterized protein n=1 Tax=Agrocybe chaxingu TaxID=84603 RepID=A0A9W8TGR4_9AGAR|nr:hypothetical protein NLJ89_g201 [Agrocybe chaxingu]